MSSCLLSIISDSICGYAPSTWCMSYFTCQLDWAMGCPDIWFNIISGCSVRVFLDATSIWIGRLSKPDHPPQCEWASPNPLRAWTEHKGGEREDLLSPPDSLSWTFVFSCPQTGNHTICAWLLRPSDLDWSHIISFPGSQANRRQITGPLILHNGMS